MSGDWLTRAAVLVGLLLRGWHYAADRTVWYDEAVLLANVLNKDWLSLLGPLFNRGRGHEPLEQRIERNAKAKHGREQQFQRTHERREGEHEPRRGDKPKRPRDALNENDDAERRRQRDRRAANTVAAVDAECARERRTGDDMREHAREGEGAVSALSPAKRPDDRRRWFGFGVAPDQRPIRRSGERGDHDGAGGDAERDAVHALTSARRSNCSWRRHIRDA